MTVLHVHAALHRLGGTPEEVAATLRGCRLRTWLAVEVGLAEPEVHPTHVSWDAGRHLRQAPLPDAVRLHAGAHVAFLDPDTPTEAP